MNFNIGEVHTVNGHQFREIYEIIDCEFGIVEKPIATEVKTPRCGWTDNHICSRACDVDCRNAKNLFDEIGVDY